MAKKTYRELNTKGKKRYIQKARDVISNINNAQTYVANTKTIYNEENLQERIKWFQNLIQNLVTSKDSLYLQVIPLSDNQFSIVRISNHTARKDNNIIGRENVYADLWLSLFFDFNGSDKAIPFNGDMDREKVSQEQLSQGIPLQRPRNVTQKIAYEINGKHLFVENDVQLLLASIKGFLENGIYTFPFNKIIENKQYNTMSNTKKRIRLTESDLHKVIKEAIKKVINEQDEGDISGAYKIKYIDSDDCYETGYWREEIVFIDMSEEDGYRIRINGYSTEDFLGMDENRVLHYVYEELKKGMTVQEALQEIMENSQTADGIVPSNYNLDESIRRAIRKVLR